MKLLLVIGYSGAGKSVAMKALADFGYEAIDNIPIKAVPAVIETVAVYTQRLAICSDVRSRSFDPDDFLALANEFSSREGWSVDIVFLACDEQVLLRRYTETRHRHPLALDRPVEDGIRLEMELLSRVRQSAGQVIDTTDFGPHDLKRRLKELFGEKAVPLTLSIVSFSYRRGIPREADLVFDVRFLRNPHYVSELKTLTGKEAPVQEFIRGDERFADFFEKLCDLIISLIPFYANEGKSHLTIAFGCTGGQHRSVFVSESLATCLEQQKFTCGIRHRELVA
jgi:UPF0042 nucleotide-binding protein